jgi:uncharacterized damage-inducible protein DinB
MRTLPRHALLTFSLLTAGSFVPAPILAQDAPASRPALMTTLLRDVQAVEEKMMGLADAIPESAYGWRPSEGVRSVGEVWMHVAADNYFLPTPLGIAAPEASGIKAGDYPSVQAFENRTATKAEAVQAMRESFVHLRQAMERTDDAALARQVSLFGMDMNGQDLWLMTVMHLHEHLGQAIAYARSNNIVPPWSR